MRKIRQLFLKPLWKVFGLFESYYDVSKNEQAFVVLGFPRSGTSLMSRILNFAGISFGDVRKFRKADSRNPKGFYERITINRIDKRLIKESGQQNPFCLHRDTRIRARGVMNKTTRVITRLRMMRQLKDIKSVSEKWGFKEIPTSFYYWSRYVPNAKVVAIFRHPLANAHSVHSTFEQDTFRQLIDLWTCANEELLYHVATHKSLVIQLEDLSDHKKRESIINAICNFVDVADKRQLHEAIEQEFRSDTMMVSDVLKESYPLPRRTQEIFDSLGHLKIT